MSEPQVSVVIPTYERPDLLQRAVRSVREQTYDDWQLYVVNDSPDVTVDGVVPDDDRITCIQHDENRGAPAARNTGIRASSGKYVALLDDDDQWKPRKLERQVHLLESLGSEFGMVYGGYEVVRDGDVVSRRVPAVQGDLLAVLLLHNVVPSPTPLIRRASLETVGLFDETLRSNQDLDLWIRIAQEYYLAVVPEVVATVHRSHSDRISADVERLYWGERELLKKHSTLFADHPEALAARCHELGMYATYTGRRSEAARAFYRSIRVGRRDPLTALYGIASLLPSPVHRRLFALRSDVVEYGFRDGLLRFLGAGSSD